jgi:hypothetical protein
LLYIQKFCLENNVFFKFHPFVFYVNDLISNGVLLFGWSRDGFYIMSKSFTTLLPHAFLFTKVLYLVVDYQTSHDLWMTLEIVLASPSNSRNMQLHVSFQDLRQNDNIVSVYLQKANALFDKLPVIGRPFSLEDFNVYVFRGLRGDFGDLVTTFSNRT